MLEGDKFVPHDVLGGAVYEGENDITDYIPDKSFGPLTAARVPTEMHSSSTLFAQSSAKEKVNPSGMQFGDIFISVGLDWEWQATGLDKVYFNLLKKKGIHVLTCCYDLIPILFPQYCASHVAKYFKDYWVGMAWSSSLILCISETTRRDLKALADKMCFPLPPTSIMPLGSSLPEEDGNLSDAVKTVIEDDFIFFVSTIERRKNHDVLYRAYHLFARENNIDRLPKLVFVGMQGWGVGDLLKDIELDPLTQGKIVILNQVNDAELRALYDHCKFFLYPSLYEGWGLPIAEALAFGKVVLASSAGSIPEVGGELVQYLDPWRPKEWANAIVELYESPELLAAKEKRIRENFKPISWRMTARSVQAAIDDLSLRNKNCYDFRPGFDLGTQIGIPYSGQILLNGGTGVLAFGPYVSAPIGPFGAELYFSKIADGVGRMCIRISCENGAKILDEINLTDQDFSPDGTILRTKTLYLDKIYDDIEVFIYVDGALKVSFDRAKFDFSAEVVTL